jgi:RimJ/RimL family protein N-acetyltransferase
VTDAVATLITPRLRLRPFRDSDRTALHAFQTDPVVMRTYGGGKPLTPERIGTFSWKSRCAL